MIQQHMTKGNKVRESIQTSDYVPNKNSAKYKTNDNLEKDIGESKNDTIS